MYSLYAAKAPARTTISTNTTKTTGTVDEEDSPVENSTKKM